MTWSATDSFSPLMTGCRPIIPVLYAVTLPAGACALPGGRPAGDLTESRCRPAVRCAREGTRMPRRPIDLRSDTVTRPSAGMRRAMFEAEVGDDVLGDDPTVIRLQERTAELFGKPAALYFPSGTQANQAALHAQTRRRRRALPARPGPHHLLRAGRRGGAQRPAAALLRLRRRHPRPRRHAGARAHRRRPALGAHPPGRTGEHAQPLRRPGLSPGEDPGGAPVLRPQRPAAAPRRRPHLERARGHRRAAGRDRRPLRHGQRVSLQGPGGAGRVAGALRRRTPPAARSGPASCSAAACGRPASSPPPACTRWSTTSSAWPRTTAGPGVWPSGWPGCRA